MSIIDRPADAPDMARAYTAEDLLRFPSAWHYELIGGRLRDMGMPTGDAHGAATALLTLFLMQHIVEAGLGVGFGAETGFLLARNPDTVKAPDFAFVSQARLPAGRGAGFVSAIPDLVLEVRSPSDRGPALAAKVREWLEAGARMVLDLDPARQIITVHRPGVEQETLGADATLNGYDVLPGFSLPLARVFH